MIEGFSGPKGHINIRIRQYATAMGLGSRMQVLMFMWSVGPPVPMAR